jgi:hypothetical protein
MGIFGLPYKGSKLFNHHCWNGELNFFCAVRVSGKVLCSPLVVRSLGPVFLHLYFLLNLILVNNSTTEVAITQGQSKYA